LVLNKLSTTELGEQLPPLVAAAPAAPPVAPPVALPVAAAPAARPSDGFLAWAVPVALGRADWPAADLPAIDWPAIDWPAADLADLPADGVAEDEGRPGTVGLP
jgi:hypothetical protein